jgi:hypothetical protein
MADDNHDDQPFPFIKNRQSRDEVDGFYELASQAFTMLHKYGIIHMGLYVSSALLRLGRA